MATQGDDVKSILVFQLITVYIGQYELIKVTQLRPDQ